MKAQKRHPLFEIKDLDQKQRLLFLRLLGLKQEVFSCDMCGEHVKREHVTVMPQLLHEQKGTASEHADLLCLNELCMTEWLHVTELEEENGERQ